MLSMLTTMKMAEMWIWSAAEARLMLPSSVPIFFCLVTAKLRIRIKFWAAGPISHGHMSPDQHHHDDDLGKDANIKVLDWLVQFPYRLLGRNELAGRG